MAIAKNALKGAQKSFTETYLIKAAASAADTQYKSLHPEIIPAGTYHTKIDGIADITIGDVVIGVNVDSTFKALSDGKTYFVRQAYLRDGTVAGRLEDLATILAGYGLTGKYLSTAVGTEETVTLTYEDGDIFGTITDRQKKAMRRARTVLGHKSAEKSKPPVDTDDEFEDEDETEEDDFLDDEEVDDDDDE